MTTIMTRKTSLTYNIAHRQYFWKYCNHSETLNWNYICSRPIFIQHSIIAHRPVKRTGSIQSFCVVMVTECGVV